MTVLENIYIGKNIANQIYYYENNTMKLLEKLKKVCPIKSAILSTLI